VAWQFLTCLSEREAIDFLFHELPSSSPEGSDQEDEENGTLPGPGVRYVNHSREDTPLLNSASPSRSSSYYGANGIDITGPSTIARSDDFSSRFANLSALEIAAVSGSKKFLSQRAVQKVINGIWRV
jgi:hypothetical protein